MPTSRLSVFASAGALWLLFPFTTGGMAAAEDLAAPTSVSSAAVWPAAGGLLAQSSEADGSSFRKWERRIDSAAGKLSGWIAFVLFYEVVGKEEVVEISDGLATDVESVRPLIERIRAQGVNTDEVDLTLTLPEKTLSKAEADELSQQLSREFTRQKAFSFKVAQTKTGDSLQPGQSKVIAHRHGVPFIVLWLVLGATFFTLRMGFINIRGFKHAVLVTAGKFDDPEHQGEVSHFQALSAALSATVGLGNIAGVAIAVMVGGPGATFWMIVAGLLGMSSKFTECTLGQQYREVRPDGRVMGGAMFYLSKGLAEMGLAPLGKALGVLFAVMCVFASFGGGNAFQVNQSLNAVQETVGWLRDHRYVYGIIMVVMVGIVIIGGIRRIASTAEKIVPLMCSVYVLACLYILLTNIGQIPTAVSAIIDGAFTPDAGYGALLGVLVMGFRRAAFSNEAGVGSAAIAHSAARTKYPVREGIVSLLEPFIDTVVVCTMTALVIVITGAYDNPDYVHFRVANNGAGLTSQAMAEHVTWFPYVLSLAVFLFAYSTMISWSYYGERCFCYLFGDRASMAYRVIFLVFVFLGSIVSATNVLDLSDLMILGMAFPNILGAVLLSGKVKRELDEYWQKHKAGELKLNR